MHILYLDDSGSPQNPNEAYFVLGGISVPENSIRWLTHQISQLAEKLDPNTYPTLEFHASEIFGGRNGIWANFKDRQARIDIIKDVLLVPENANANSEIVTFACAIHKASFPNVDPVELAYEEITDRFNKYLERISQRNQPQRGLIVLDKTSYEYSLQNLAKSIRESGNKWGSNTRSICEVPMFVDSKASRIVQLADHIAYAVFRYYDRDDMTYYKCISDRFDSNGGRIYGLIHKQNYLRNCHCPYCLSKINSSS